MNRYPNIIAILSYGRSGTGLASSLFDGHKDISIFPDHILQNFYDFWRFYSKKNKKLVIGKFTEIFEIFFEPSEKKNYFHKSVGIIGSAYSCGFTQLGKNKNKTIRVNKKKFIRYLNNFFLNNEFNRRNFFISVHFAYNYCLYNKLNTKFIVFNFHVPSKKNFKSFFNDFPDANFLQMIREPLPAMYSMFRAFNEKKFFNGNYINFILDMMKSRGNYEFVKTNKILYLKLEDLHSNPKKAIKKICKKFSINFENILLKSTINNLMWHNEIGSSVRVSGFSKKVIQQKYHKFFWPKDDLIFFKFLKDKYSFFNYKSNKYNSVLSAILFYVCILIPFKIEILQIKKIKNFQNLKILLINYLKNRILILKYFYRKKFFRIN